MSEVIVAGHICLDVIPAFYKSNKTIEEIFVPGKLINMDKVKISTGGPVSNTGIAMSILGADVSLMGKIGDDMFGTVMLKELEKTGHNKGMIVAEGENTSYTVVIVPPGYDRIFLHHTGANDTFCADDINYDMVKGAKLFHFGYPPLMKNMYENGGKELIEIFKRVKAIGVTTSLDMSIPDSNSPSGKVDWEEILKGLLPYVDIYIPSVEETMYMIDRNEFDALNANADGNDPLLKLDINKLQDLGNKLIAMGAKIAVIKCGVRGYYIRTNELDGIGKAKPSDMDNWARRELFEESFHVDNVAAATGSGDSSIAGFLTAYLNGKSIEETIKIACAVGGQNVKTYDALSGIKTWQEVIDMIPSWDKNKQTIDGGYWKYNTQKGVWFGQKDSKESRKQ